MALTCSLYAMVKAPRYEITPALISMSPVRLSYLGIRGKSQQCKVVSSEQALRLHYLSVPTVDISSFNKKMHLMSHSLDAQ
jgi:hypothetical protein